MLSSQKKKIIKKITFVGLPFYLSVFCIPKDSASVHQENQFLGKHDIALSNIECMYQITDRKRRLISPSQKISSKLEALHIVCKVNYENDINLNSSNRIHFCAEFPCAQIWVPSIRNRQRQTYC